MYFLYKFVHSKYRQESSQRKFFKKVLQKKSRSALPAAIVEILLKDGSESFENFFAIFATFIIFALVKIFLIVDGENGEIFSPLSPFMP